MPEQRIATSVDILHNENLDLLASLSELDTTLDQGEEHSVYLRAIREPFDTQMNRLLVQRDGGYSDNPEEERKRLDPLYKEFLFTGESVEPTVEELAEADRLKEHFEDIAEYLAEQWDAKKLQRIIRVFKPDGTSDWVYNSKVSISVPEVSQWQLRQVESFRVWWPEIQISPLRDETGMYVPVEPDGAVIVLPDFEEDVDHIGQVIELHSAAAHLAAAEIEEPEQAPDSLPVIPRQIARTAFKHVA